MTEWGTRENPWPMSVGDLDGWEYYKNAEHMTQEMFLARLNRTEEFAVPAIVGSCFHKAVENAMNKYEPDSTERKSIEELRGNSGEMSIGFGVQPILAVDLQAYNIVEQDVEYITKTPFGWVALRGVVDGVFGHIVRDLKTTKKQFKDVIERHQDSWQWRAYLVAMGEQYRKFEYHLFRVKYQEQELGDRLAKEGKGWVVVTDYMQHDCWRYPGIADDLNSAISELTAFYRHVGWTPPPKRQMEAF